MYTVPDILENQTEYIYILLQLACWNILTCYFLVTFLVANKYIPSNFKCVLSFQRFLLKILALNIKQKLLL